MITEKEIEVLCPCATYEEYDKKKESIPNLMGIYVFFNEKKEVLYIGYSGTIKERISQYYNTLTMGTPLGGTLFVEYLGEEYDDLISNGKIPSGIPKEKYKSGHNRLVLLVGNCTSFQETKDRIDEKVLKTIRKMSIACFTIPNETESLHRNWEAELIENISYSQDRILYNVKHNTKKKKINKKNINDKTIEWAKKIIEELKNPRN